MELDESDLLPTAVEFAHYRGVRRIEDNEIAAKKRKKRRKSCGYAFCAFSRLFLSFRRADDGDDGGGGLQVFRCHGLDLFQRHGFVMSILGVDLSVAEAV